VFVPVKNETLLEHAELPRVDDVKVGPRSGRRKKWNALDAEEDVLSERSQSNNEGDDE
jgi:hypothetical protein